jgi:hypothetical protein
MSTADRSSQVDPHDGVPVNCLANASDGDSAQVGDDVWS